MDALCWIDIETTGLDPERDKVLELYVKVTDFSFLPLHEFHMWVTKVSRDWGGVDSFVRNMHEESGLWDEMDQVPIEDFYWVRKEQMDIDFSGHLEFAKEKYGIETLYPAGSSVHFDMGFLKALGLPLSMKLLSHRHFDVTTLKLFMVTQTGFFPEFKEIEPKHRAYSDVHSSIIAAKEICAPMADTSLKAAHVGKVIQHDLGS